ncbi:MAG: hypothetical protein Ct9H300mP3_02170 [Gammaproteobacteria bacterium]|nr:MAG: hypothetical protein Ct9H300mP3_02170 [Gammaproteobacteria bacterium]
MQKLNYLTWKMILEKKLVLIPLRLIKAFLDREKLEEKPDIDEEILLEAANVLSDFIKYSYRPVVSMGKTG